LTSIRFYRQYLADAKDATNRDEVQQIIGKLQSALDDFNLSIKYAPRFLLGYTNRARVRTLMQDFDGAIADFAIVAARTGSSGRETDISLFLVDMKAEGVEAKSLINVDPSRGQAELTFRNCKAEPLGRANEGWSIVSQLLDRAAVLMAFEQVGGADRALEMGRDYALDRIAFGRPIGSFQAVKHMLADMYVSATLARSNCYYGAWALSSDASELPEAAAAARISATQAFQHCSKNNIQVHGGMGFTWEFDCHMYYRRANAMALSLGSLSYWEDALIDRMRKKNAA